MTPFQKAYAAARAQKQRTFEFPPGSGKMYSTTSAEEQGREIGARAAKGSGRGVSAGRTASDVDTATGGMRSGGMPPPAASARPAVTISSIPGLLYRGMVEGAERVPAGRGMGAALMGGMTGATRGVPVTTAAARLAEANRAAAAARVPPPLAPRQPVFTRSDAALDRAMQEAMQRPLGLAGNIPAFKKGGLVKKPKMRK